MTHDIKLLLRYSKETVNLENCCISMRFDKERYSAYTELHGQWYCPSATKIDEIAAVILYIDNAVVHNGYPNSLEILKKDGRTVLSVSSVSYTAALVNNQCEDGLITQVNLADLITRNGTYPGVQYEKDTPTVNYVNYYDGTSVWDSIVCYALRTTKTYPYIAGFNTVRVSPPEARKTFSIVSGDLTSRGNCTDYSRMISSIYEKDIDGTPKAFTIMNTAATQRSIVRRREINFDREWIMDAGAGLNHRIDYSMRAVNCDVFSWLGYNAIDLLDMIKVTDIGFSGEIDRIRVTASAEKGIETNVWCYHDNYCNN